MGILTVAFLILSYFAGKIFDHNWDITSSVPLVNLNLVYAAPNEYNNFSKLNLHLISENFVAVEGNKRFKLMNDRGETKGIYTYLDSVLISRPDTGHDYINKIYLNFEDQTGTDSIYLIVSKSGVNGIYYNQIFYNSVTINKLNELSTDTEEFRINQLSKVDPYLLKNNDSLINSAFKYFNENASNLGLAECGTNSSIFNRICKTFNVPSRIVWLQKGDEGDAGFGNKLGYPLHVVCEVYSSTQNKWYVVDPSNGSRFRESGKNSFMSSVELSASYFFGNINEIEQDSVLVLKNKNVGYDYFKYYENVSLGNPYIIENILLKKFFAIAYSKFNHGSLLYSNNLPFKRNGYYYFGLKSFLYFVILIIYVSSVLFLFANRLFSVKKP